MREMQDPLKDALQWVETARPTITQKLRQTAFGVHFEEVSEMLATLKGNDRMTQSLLTAAMISVHALALHLKTSKPDAISVGDHTELLDALCDQIVTSVNVAQAQVYDIIGAMNEVNRSNFSKFVNGAAVFDENMKIAKGPDYQKANLAPFTHR